MNDYRITYTGESEGYQTITERSEAAAKKVFLSANKGIKLDITSIELYRENTCATKEQEREALAAIKKMVEELGPESYLATAFDGCFEDAENNIENDFGDSMKARWLHADAQLNAANGTIEELKDDKAALTVELEHVKSSAEILRQRSLDLADLAHLTRLAEKDLSEAEQRRDEAAADIVKYADDPASEQFRQAVADHRNAQASVEAKQERLARLNAIRNAG